MSEETWQKARLIPISGIGGSEERERRATSALLAVVGAVKEFGKTVLGRFGAPAGTVSTYCEVPFELPGGKRVRVDGLIRVQRGHRTWSLVVEVKTRNNELTTEQVEAYLEVVRENGFDGLLTISNEIVPVVGHHPVKVDGRKYGRVPLYHISWTRILMLGHMVKEHQGVSDPDQAWILGELIRYLEYEGSGALAFEDMGPNWTVVRTAVREGTLRFPDEGADEVAARWDQLVQYLCLGLGARLGREVRPVLSRREVDDPDARIVSISRELTQDGTLSATLRIPDAIGPITLIANLRTMLAAASTEVKAPELKRALSRVTWLVRQLRKAPPELRLDLAFQGTRTTSSELLQQVLEDPKRVLPQDQRIPRSFVLTLSHAIGTKRRAGQGSFIGGMSSLLDRFYHDVVQDLNPWTPPAPQLRLPASEGPEPKAVEASPSTEVPWQPQSSPPLD